MDIGDWVMTNDFVGQICKIGGMFCQVRRDDGYRKVIPTDEIYPITKEVADIIRGV